MSEDDETDNAFSRTYRFIDGDPVVRFRPSGLVTIINPYLKRADALSLAQDPPLRRELWLDPIAEPLREAMDTVAKNAKLSVMIVPAERLDPLALGAALKDAAPATRRDAVMSAARSQTDRGLEALRPTLDALAKSGQAGTPRALWLPGLIAVELSPPAIAALASDPRVARLWLDDVLCEPFGHPADRLDVRPGQGRRLASDRHRRRPGLGDRQHGRRRAGRPPRQRHRL